MAEIDPWDDVLEGLTAKLVGMAEGKGKPAGFRTDNGWLVAMAVVKQKLTVEFLAPDPADPGLDDYEKVIVYGLSYHVPKPWPARPTFRKTLTLHEDYRWEEQMLREVALEALGLARHVLHAREVAIRGDGDSSLEGVGRGGKLRRRR